LSCFDIPWVVLISLELFWYPLSCFHKTRHFVDVVYEYCFWPTSLFHFDLRVNTTYKPKLIFAFLFASSDSLYQYPFCWI
jgi:hypothetical protein